MVVNDISRVARREGLLIKVGTLRINDQFPGSHPLLSPMCSTFPAVAGLWTSDAFLPHPPDYHGQ